MLFLVSLRKERRKRRKDKTVPRFLHCHGCATMTHRSELVPMGNDRLICADCRELFWPPLDFSALRTEDLYHTETDQTYLTGLVGSDLA